MDPTLYTSLVTRRGFDYTYYHSRASGDRPTLLFIHGFPSTSEGWRKQIEYFQPLGYGILAPDMLGSGRSSRPLELEDYKLNLVASDMVEILGAEGLEEVVGIGHDWGCVVLSRLSILYPERFLGFVWLGSSFMDPVTEHFDLDSLMRTTRESLGHESYGFWKFFQRRDAADVVQDHVDSFLQLMYPKDPSYWLVYMALPGKTDQWIEDDMQPGYPSYMSEADIANARRSVLENGGIRASLSWYISQLENTDLEDNMALPKERWYIQQPSFYAIGLRDAICPSQRGKTTMEKYARAEVRVAEFETGHWIHLEAPSLLNRELEAWLTELAGT
ncbi:hypothetical protein AAF712_009982 [Marasmius tenuissimus]|uniref:AB hydrolase-1 domain-containing protein n=1 Tax=Marasmius tenuissimus TaxID=585030 RepID=A0ABR2ZN41_9AGAR